VEDVGSEGVEDGEHVEVESVVLLQELFLGGRDAAFDEGGQGVEVAQDEGRVRDGDVAQREVGPVPRALVHEPLHGPLHHAAHRALPARRLLRQRLRVCAHDTRHTHDTRRRQLVSGMCVDKEWGGRGTAAEEEEGADTMAGKIR
jgi:hypothetical protein